MDERPWELRSSEPVIETPWFEMVKNHYYIPALEKDKEYYLLNERAGVNIIAITVDNRVVITRQYRPGIGSVTTEFPAGFIEDADTEILARARQELLEETGYGGGVWHYAGYSHSMPNRAHKRDHCFLAVGVSKLAEQHVDEDEVISFDLLPVAEIDELILKNEIVCTACIAQWHRAMALQKKL